MFLIENLLIATLLVAAILPLIGLLRGRGRARIHLMALAFLSLVLLAATVRRPVEDLDLPVALPNATDHDGTRSSSTCKGCHPGQYATWHQSFHRTMTQAAGPDTVVAPFDGRKLEVRGRAFVVDRHGDEFWVTEVQPGLSSVVEISPAKRVMMTTGSHHQQIYWTAAADGSLVQFPWVYEIADEIWIPTEDSFLQPGNWTQSETKWNRDCIRCHSVGASPNFDFEAENWDTQVTELGIACNACHGPAEEHIAEYHDPFRRHVMRASNKPDPTIVNPERLPHQRSSEVCGQCHAFATFHDGFHGDAWVDYSAGNELDAHFKVTMGSENDNAFWPDDVARIGGREFNTMTLSECYTNGEMGCLSCHTMHGDEPKDQLVPSMDGDEACLQCHGEFRDRIAEHTFHKTESSGSRCLNCHMPHTSYALLGTARMHLVDSPIASGRTTNERPNACNLCHLDKTLAWTADYLNQWYETPVVDLSDDHEEVAAAVLWALRGDAAQRVIVAWHMGQPWALEASGDSWVTPYLARLLEDPYSAIRLIAHRSLRQIAETDTIPYDHIGPPEERARASRAFLEAWMQKRFVDGVVATPATLVQGPGRLHMDRVSELYDQRDNRRIVLAE